MKLTLLAIFHQQEKLTNQAKQILALKSEKEQQEARICRMERRWATHKRHFDPDEHPTTKTKVSNT